MRGQRLRRVVLATVLAACFVWARKPGDPFKPGYNVYSRQQDIQLGQAAAAQVRAKYPEVADAFLRDYIRRVGERLANTQEARLSQFQFQFALLNEPIVNAFALPGGPMFVFTGLVKATDNEAELAGVMAHEMSHVILRHGTHEASKAKTVSWTTRLGAALAAAALGNAAGAAQLATMGVGLGQNSLILHFSREAETEADLLGSHLMAESGYDPLEMAHFFKKLGMMHSAGLQFFSDHPNPGNREHAIEEEVRGLPQRTYGYETGLFERAKVELAGLPPVGPGSAGTTTTPLPPQVEPSGAWKEAQVKPYRVQYPANWTAYVNSGTSIIVIAPAGGAATLPNGQINLSLGSMLGYFQPDSKQMSLGTATLNLVNHLHNQDSSLQMTSTEQHAVKVDGSDGLVSVLQARSPSLGPETYVLLTVARPQGLFFALSMAPVGNFAQLQKPFDQILQSIRFLE
ncbi:MAG: M48 family metalloprotease [Acidobacteriia bacterium]|nr:M48 family metalloprotease [Terriglobia bacterium]